MTQQSRSQRGEGILLQDFELESQPWADAIMNLSDPEGLHLKTINPSLKEQHPFIHVWHSRVY